MEEPTLLPTFKYDNIVALNFQMQMTCPDKDVIKMAAEMAEKQIFIDENSKKENPNDQSTINNNNLLTQTRYVGFISNMKINKDNVNIYKLINSSLCFYYYCKNYYHAHDDPDGSKLNTLARLNSYYKDQIYYFLTRNKIIVFPSDRMTPYNEIFCFNELHLNYASYDTCILTYAHMFTNQTNSVIKLTHMLNLIVQKLHFNKSIKLRYNYHKNHHSYSGRNDPIIKLKTKFPNITGDGESIAHEKTLKFYNRTRCVTFYLDEPFWDAIEYDNGDYYFNLQNKIMTLIYYHYQ